MPFYDIYDSSVQNIREHLHIPTNAVDVSPRYGNSNSNIARDTVFLTYVTPMISLNISQITMAVAGQGVSGSTGAQMGLYTVDESGLTLVAETANDATLFNSTFANFTRLFSNTRGLPTTYGLVAGSRYAVAVLHHASTVPSLYKAHAFVPNSINVLEPRMMARKTSETGLLPLTIDDAELSNTTSDPWARLS